jgi:DNA-binding response OmpR family regulator
MSNRLALIIEDAVDLAVIFAEAVRAAGFRPEIIRTGDAALERLAVTVPDIVVLDLHLPHVAGTTILQRIRGDARLVQTKVIIATADPRMAEPFDGEADLVLLKPISFSQLRDLALRLGSNATRGK